MVWVLGMCPVETLDIREQSSAREPGLPRVTYATVLGVCFLLSHVFLKLFERGGGARMAD